MRKFTMNDRETSCRDSELCLTMNLWKIKILLSNQLAGQQIITRTKTPESRGATYPGQTFTINAAHEKQVRNNKNGVERFW